MVPMISAKAVRAKRTMGLGAVVAVMGTAALSIGVIESVTNEGVGGSVQDVSGLKLKSVPGVVKGLKLIPGLVADKLAAAATKAKQPFISVSKELIENYLEKDKLYDFKLNIKGLFIMSTRTQSVSVYDKISEEHKLKWYDFNVNAEHQTLRAKFIKGLNNRPAILISTLVEDAKAEVKQHERLLDDIYEFQLDIDNIAAIYTTNGEEVKLGDDVKVKTDADQLLLKAVNNI